MCGDDVKQQTRLSQELDQSFGIIEKKPYAYRNGLLPDNG
jgi:hypothetical protein